MGVGGEGKVSDNEEEKVEREEIESVDYKKVDIVFELDKNEEKRKKRRADMDQLLNLLGEKNSTNKNRKRQNNNRLSAGNIRTQKWTKDNQITFFTYKQTKRG